MQSAETPAPKSSFSSFSFVGWATSETSVRTALPLLILGLVMATAAPAQVGFGTLLQSISTLQNPGVTAVGVPGNPSITVNEVLAWSQGEANGRMRALFNTQAIGIALGDLDGDGLPLDTPDIDAIGVGSVTLGTNEPSIFDLRLSFAVDVAPLFGAPITSGDVIRLTGIGTRTNVVTRSQLQASLGTTSALNVDGFAELPDGAILVTFNGNGVAFSCNNVLSPLTGQPGSAITCTGGDVFLIRPPFGALPAIFAYRQAELASVVSSSVNYGSGYTLSEVRDIEAQPNVPYIDNPSNDLLNAYASGMRPRLLWVNGNDDNVFCFGNAQFPTINPRTSANNVYCLVGNGTASAAGYATNTSSSRVFVDGLAIWPQAMAENTRSTLDVSTHFPTAGSTTFQLAVRSPEPAGARFQLVMALAPNTGLGFPVGSAGFRNLFLSVTDPLLLFSLDPGVVPLLVSVAADALGTAVFGPYPIPTGSAGVRIWFQAFELATPFALTTPTLIRIQ